MNLNRWKLLLGRRGSGLYVPPTTPAPSPTLNALSLSQSSFTIGTPASGTINGATAGSTIGATGLPTGFTINGAARTWNYDGTGSAGTVSPTFTETLAGATNTPRQTVIGITYSAAAAVQTITPSGSYVSGTEGSGGAAPTASTSTFGSGSDAEPSLHFAVFKGEDVYSTDTVIAYAGTADDGGINFVEFSVEGGTAVQVTQMIQHPGNPRIFGFPIRVNMTGRGYLYAKARPVNGREVVERILIRGCGNTAPTIVQEYYVDRINGNDSWNGKSATFTSGSTGPWKTLTKAMNSNGVGADADLGSSGSPNFRVIISGRRRINLVQSGEHEYDLGTPGTGLANGARVENKDKLIVRRAPGNTGDTWITKLTRGALHIAYDWVEFQGVGLSVANIPTSEIGSIQNVCGFPVDSVAFTQGSKVFHPDGAAGTLSYGYPLGGVNGDGVYVPGIFAKGSYYAIAESDIDCPDPCGGLKFVRASRGRYAGFAGHFTDSRQAGTCFWDTRWTQFAGGEGRVHTESELTVNAATYDSGANETTITLTGAPTIQDQGPFSFGSSEYYMRALTGPKVGGGGKNDSAGLAYENEAGNTFSYPPTAAGTTAFDTAGWRIKSMNNTTKTIVVFGNASGIQNGNLIRCYYLGHPDCIAIYGCDNEQNNPTGQHRNLLWQNVAFIGPTQTTPFLCQAYAAPDSSTGDASVTITAANGATSFSYSSVRSGAQLRAGDFVRDRATGQYLLVKSIDSGNGTTSGTGTFYDPTSAAWSSAACTFSRAPARVSMVNYISHKQTVDETPGYFNYAASDWSVRGYTFVGRRPANGLLQLDTQNGTFDNRSCWAARNVRFSGGIVQAISRDTGSGPPTGWLWSDARNHVISQALGNSVASAADGTASFPAGYSSYLPSTTKKAVAADVVQAPWDIDGNARTAGVSVLGSKVA